MRREQRFSSRIRCSLGKVRFLLWGDGPGYFRFFCEKSRGPPTPWNGLMHDPSEIPKQKHHAHYSSDSVGGTSAAGKSESASSERWKDLGWFPNPKGEYTGFSNSILPKFYLSFWITCPYTERFRHCFVTERKRQWEVREALKATNHRTPRGSIKIWARADTGRERQLC